MEAVGFFSEYQPNMVTCQTERGPEAPVVTAALLFLWSGKAAMVGGFQGCMVGLGLFWFFY